MDWVWDRAYVRTYADFPKKIHVPSRISSPFSVGFLVSENLEIWFLVTRDLPWLHPPSGFGFLGFQSPHHSAEICLFVSL